MNPSDARTWSTSRYRAGDEHDLLALFNRVFGLHRSLEHWRWQFERNPYAPPTMILARRNSDGLLAGSHVVMPIPLCVSGSMLLGAHTLDLVVHEEFRRQGVFQITARECFEWCLERGMRVVIAFPNQQSYPGFVRSLGWSRILVPQRWSRRVGIRGLLGAGGAARTITWAPDLLWRALSHAGHLPGRGEGHVEWRSSVPADQDDLWRACAPDHVLSLWKDARYLAWRYDANPDHDFEYAVLRGGGGPRGVAVVLREQGRTTVCELMWPRSEGPAAGLTLVRSIVARATELGDDVVLFLGHDTARFGAAMQGFRVRPAPENVLTGRGLEDGEIDRLVRDGANWTMTFGDADYV
jgi:GNAT superfamily N-acetyltransferase